MVVVGRRGLGDLFGLIANRFALKRNLFLFVKIYDGCDLKGRLP